MSDSQTYEEVTVASDGVTVTKRFEADEFPVPAIAFNVQSRRTEPVTLRLVDEVPEDVAVEDLGFHPEYGSEYWDINEDRIAFEKEVEADADYTTVYGIRATGTDDVEKFLTEPKIESVDPPTDGDDADLVGGGDDAVRDVIAGDADSVPGLEDEDDEDIETLDLKDPNRPGGGDGATHGDGDEAAPDVEDGVVAAMADEIRRQNVSPEDVKLLQRALDAVSEDDEPTDGVNEARIERIQGDISDLRAYTDALEEFLAENGTGDQMISDFSDRLERFESELASFESDIQSAKSTAQSASEDVSRLDDEVQTVESDVNDVEGTVDELDDQLDDLESELDSLREEIGDGEVDERLTTLEDEIEELKQWREQLSSVIGGGN
ncbi:hypothetical protein KTS45_02725 [Halomicroarcula limicola]|uniref:Uncharacterized protein n=1 Tax=Haloarcula limicola TaxID=1429915 RepID=A0A8J7Y7H6_9EURY|nr:hypothetical protein [Halomicroarcula limicola]MBV0923103.1 hypothetical protein [Halomicroarcula limicola]